MRLSLGYAAEEESNRLEVKRVVEETDKLKALLEEARMEITRHVGWSLLYNGTGCRKRKPARARSVWLK